jgi:hypothetical protein
LSSFGCVSFSGRSLLHGVNNIWQEVKKLLVRHFSPFSCHYNLLQTTLYLHKTVALHE